MAPSHFDQRIRDWSARKHAILKQYLPTFCTALSRRAAGGPIWYVDGYAGAGVYKNPADSDDPGSPGSPILAAQITQELPYDIRCLNVEEDRDNFESLERETASFPHVTNIHADLNDVIDAVLQLVQNAPAFFFLDPFGTRDLPMRGLIDRIALRTRQTDILLRYATETVRRLAGAYEKDAIRSVAHAQNLDNWFRGNQWQKTLQQHPTGPKRDAELLKYYKEQLASISGGQLKFVKDYPIRSIDGQVKYHMVFASGDQLGIKLMSDILYKAEAQYHADYEAHQQKGAGPYSQLGMFDEPVLDPAIQQARHIEKIQAAILKVGQNIKREWRFFELHCELIINQGWFAHFSEKDLRAACKALHAQSRIERITSGSAWQRETRFRIV
jgi:three-Cys-motif partner protein